MSCFGRFDALNVVTQEIEICNAILTVSYPFIAKNYDDWQI